MESSATKTQTPASSPKADASFPYEAQSEHWNVDFSNSKEVYQGSALPVWILAGWAIFIIWAIIYIMAGARTAF